MLGQVTFFLFLLIFVNVADADEDLYRILGVTRSASTKEIKQAYRRKARDTHPDKNKNVPPEEAAEAFRNVVHAFEVLSDTASRNRYDRTGRTDGATATSSSAWDQQRSGGGSHSGSFHFFHWNFQRRTFRLKDRFDVQQAQSRVLHVVSLEQLETIMLDDEGRLEKNLLMCFVTPGEIQTLAEDEMVFPYPFAAMSSQRIWWEDILQAVQVRYHRSNDLSRFFDIPDGDTLNQQGLPIFLFGKRGQTMSDPFARLQTSNRKEFEAWAWQRIEVVVNFVNQHDSAVELYWIHGTRATFQDTIEAGGQVSHRTMLTHEWFARDVRVDSRPDSPNRYKLSLASSLGSWKILDDTDPQSIVIESQLCYDLSGHCPFWHARGECQKNPRFMTEECKLTCGACTRSEPKQNSNSSHDHDEL